jgi:hypothetical protein
MTDRVILYAVDTRLRTQPNIRCSQPPTLSAADQYREHVRIILAIVWVFGIKLVLHLLDFTDNTRSLLNMWHFLDLNHEQKLERRRLLDLYSSLAQVSALIPLALLQLYFVATWLQRRWLRKHGADAIPSSPHLKKQQSDALNGPVMKFRCFWQEAMWWMGDTIDVFGSRMAKGEILSSLIWTAWLIFLSCVQTQGGTFWSCFGALAAAKY